MLLLRWHFLGVQMFNVRSPSAGGIRGPFQSVAGFRTRGASSIGGAGPHSVKAGVQRVCFGYNANMAAYASSRSHILELSAIEFGIKKKWRI